MRKQIDRPMSLMLDTNVIMDIMLERHPYFNSSYLALRNILENGDRSMITASSVTDIYYLLRRGKVESDKAKETIRMLLGEVSAASIGQADLMKALDLDMKDFEYAVVAAVAKRNKAEYIITRNKKDFEGSDPEAITPDEFLEMIGFDA